MTTIICSVEECQYNENGLCGADMIQIDDCDCITCEVGEDNEEV